jgi:hypothetical protein
VQVVDDDENEGMVKLVPGLGAIRHVLAHYSSSAPDLQLINPLTIDVVAKICESRELPEGRDLELLSTYAEGVHQLLKHDAATAKKGKISKRLQKLLSMSLGVARAGLRGVHPCVTKPWRDDMSPFERMVRTGTYTTTLHRVIRTLPPFHSDYINEMARLRSARASSLDKDALEKINVALAESTEQAKSLGGCTKFKTSHRALTPGIFTVFCGGCGVCELFELMDHAECPLTPFRIFAHRAWRPKDLEAHDTTEDAWLDSIQH